MISLKRAVPVHWVSGTMLLVSLVEEGPVGMRTSIGPLLSDVSGNGDDELLRVALGRVGGRDPAADVDFRRACAELAVIITCGDPRRPR
jgi:hypothetical protein